LTKLKADCIKCVNFTKGLPRKEKIQTKSVKHISMTNEPIFALEEGGSATPKCDGAVTSLKTKVQSN
jgi:hypothetical protein